MEYLDYLTKTNPKYEQLKLNVVKYNTKTAEVGIQLLFPDKFGVMTEIEKVQIKQATEKYLEHKYKVIIAYKKSYVDVEVIWHFAEQFFKENAKFVDTMLAKNNFDVKQVDSVDSKQNENYDNFVVTINLTKSLYDAFVSQNIASALKAFLEESICANFEIALKDDLAEQDLASVLKMNDNHATELSILRDVSIPDEDKYFSFEIVEKFINEVPEEVALRLDQLKTAGEKIVIAGTIQDIRERTYTPKKAKQDEEAKEKTLYNFTIEDYWGKMTCVYFPTQNTTETIKQLKVGDTVAFCGDLDSFNNRWSFKISAIAYAKLGEKPEENIQWRKPFDEYLVVKPEPYIEMSQMNLLEEKKEEEISEYLMTHDVVMFDFETTGLSVEDCYILELGAVKIEKGKLTDSFESLVKPPVPIPEEITNLTHITQEMVENAPPYELVLADFYKFTRGCVLSAYNIDFDAKFLDKYGKSILYNFDNEQIDALVVARKKLKGLPNYKLKTVVTALDVELVSAHRALDDAVAAAKVLQKLV